MRRPEPSRDRGEGDPLSAVLNSEAIYVGGGNSFLLIRELHRTGLVEATRRESPRGSLPRGQCRGQRGIPHDDDDERHADSSPPHSIRWGSFFPDQPSLPPRQDPVHGWRRAEGATTGSQGPEDIEYHKQSPTPFWGCGGLLRQMGRVHWDPVRKGHLVQSR